ncbi:YceD family protein [Tropicibacter oceani]|uniref:DUF177 domain-containing protein n=1 Tax=Tropicibacter oceani TaxID=3058420 RepID=A0ABY8QE88_9RHOB|nr:DUF177 domain-containing protein [Tropicibacter oceani]WGW02758.1 DUF177 domain-containing protein [Tropicibacter oceani]
MSKPSPKSPRLRVSELRTSGETAFLLEPDAAQNRALAAEIGADSLRKTRFEGKVSPKGRRGWLLRGQLGATAVQPCSITLDPVTTRIDTPVVRHFVPADQLETYDEAGAETEMPEDDTLEPLGDVIDLEAVLAEALSLALPSYPRKEGADLGEAVFTEDGAAPLRDEDVKPFAGLAALRDKLQGDGE